jgi:ABC-type lipoprotein export system ATPase subunit
MIKLEDITEEIISTSQRLNRERDITSLFVTHDPEVAACMPCVDQTEATE